MSREQRSPFVLHRPGSSPPSVYYQFLHDRVLECSFSFAKTLPMLPNPLREWSYCLYLFVRLIDEFEDNSSLSRDEKSHYMGLVNEILEGNSRNIRELETKLSMLKPTNEKYSRLFREITTLVHAFDSLPSEVKNAGKKHLGEMITGLSTTEIREIYDIEDLHEYCHYSTGVVGNMIAELIHLGGYVNQETFHKMTPTPIKRSRNANPSSDWAVALQLVNNIRDFHEDIGMGINRWPQKYFTERGVTVGNVFHASRKQPQLTREKIEGVHEMVCKDAIGYYESGISFIELLPRDYPEIIDCFGTLYGMVGATLRVVTNSSFLYDPLKRNMKIGEIENIRGLVRKLSRNNGDLEEFLTYVSKEHAARFSA